MSNQFFQDYIERAQKIALDRSVRWNFRVHHDGKIDRTDQWSLSEMAGAAPTPEVRLTNIGTDRKTVELLRRKGRTPSEYTTNWNDWHDLVKAIIIHKIYVSRNKPAGIKSALIRPLLCLMAVAGDSHPCEVNAKDVQNAYELLCELQPSKKLAQDLRGLVKTIIDGERLSNFSPILPLMERTAKRQRLTTTDVRKRLSERKQGAKLPVEKAFWEIARIVWQEHPASFADLMRFSVLRVLIMCGLRISEVVTLPKEWRQNVQYFESNKSLPRQAIKQSLALRYFASKKRTERDDSISLYEAIQHIPEIFDDALRSTLDEIEKVTEPLRRRLRSQCETGRLFPEFEPTDLVHVYDMYPRMTGEPFVFEDPMEEELTAQWRETYNLEILEEITARQKFLQANRGKTRAKFRIYLTTRLTFVDHKTGEEKRVPLRDRLGNPIVGRNRFKDSYLLVEDLEHHFSQGKSTKQSDTTPFNLADGTQMSPAELLFLVPKRALGEERNGMICDVRKYAFVGIVHTSDVMAALNDREAKTTNSLFSKYGNSSDAKGYQINSHAFRHLQNTELFRLGIADTLITKRYNRNSVQQSYVYDHRSLAEELEAIDIPEDAQPYLFGKSADVFRMIAGGMATGPIVVEFKSIQQNEGDLAAYAFLAVEADGLHTTPYGHCINSFTVDPCPKHLECFNGCIHLTRSPLSEHTKSLDATLERMQLLLNSIEDHPAPSAAKTKMREQAETRIAAIKKMLATPIGNRVFPDGQDLLSPMKNKLSGPFND